MVWNITSEFLHALHHLLWHNFEFFLLHKCCCRCPVSRAKHSLFFPSPSKIFLSEKVSSISFFISLSILPTRVVLEDWGLVRNHGRTGRIGPLVLFVWRVGWCHLVGGIGMIWGGVWFCVVSCFRFLVLLICCRTLVWFFPFVFRDKKGENGLRGSRPSITVVETLSLYISLSTIILGYVFRAFRFRFQGLPNNTSCKFRGLLWTMGDLGSCVLNCNIYLWCCCKCVFCHGIDKGGVC